MTQFYSPSRGGFFDDQINRMLPDDCVPLKPGQRQALHAALANGKVIRVTANQEVQAVAPMPPAIDDRRAQLHTAVKREASRRILAIAPMWQQLNDLRMIATGVGLDGSAAVARCAAIDAVRTASNLLDQVIDKVGARALARLDVTAPIHWPTANPPGTSPVHLEEQPA